MAKHTRIRTDEQRKRLAANRETLLAAIRGAASDANLSTQTAGFTLVLERFVVDRSRDLTVPYEGPTGVEALLHELSRTYTAQQVTDGRLVGVGGRLAIEGWEQTCDLKATVGVGAQVRLAVGPSAYPAQLVDAVRVFDRHAHLACRSLGHGFELVAQGYNPYATSPSDIVPVPLSSFALLNAHLSRTGRYARDALRCSAGTIVRLPVAASEQAAVRDYRLFAALAPVLAFLTDNSLCMRGSDPYLTPRMARSLVWDQLDVSRCGLVPTTFDDGFGFTAYERWLERVRPICFTSDAGVTFSTGLDSCEKLMEERELSLGEAQRLLEVALPHARWDTQLTLMCADALPPRLVGGYLALIKGLTANDETRGAAEALLDMGTITDVAVAAAWHELYLRGWDARVYGRPIAQIAHELANYAASGLDLRAERDMLESLTQLWEVRLVPRDLLLRTWERNLAPSPDKEAIELYGEGAVIPYDELLEEPPAGQTSVMPIIC